MRRSISALLAGLMLGSALLSACAPASTATPEVVKETVPVQQTVVVTQVARPTEAHSAIPGSIQINSAGATFPLPLYTEWTYAYQYVDPAVAINYQGIGSGGGKGNPGVAAAVQNPPNSLSYVELDYALVNKIAYTKMVNKAGTTVTANGDSLLAAMSDFSDTFTDKLTNTIVDAPETDSWPIAGYTYYVLHTTSMTDCAKAEKLLQYIQWTLTDTAAAKKAADLGYVVLPDAVREQVIAKLSEVTCNGALVPK